LDGDGNAEDATQYQMNAKFFFNRPLASNANGTGFEIQGCTPADPANTSAKLIEVHHNVTNNGGDALNYYGRTDNDDNVQTKSSLGSYLTSIGNAVLGTEQTFTKVQNFGKNINLSEATTPSFIRATNYAAKELHFSTTDNESSPANVDVLQLKYNGQQMRAGLRIFDCDTGATNAAGFGALSFKTHNLSATNLKTYLLFEGSGSHDGTNPGEYTLVEIPHTPM
jgi:hypothetical protein